MTSRSFKSSRFISFRFIPVSISGQAKTTIADNSRLESRHSLVVTPNLTAFILLVLPYDRYAYNCCYFMCGAPDDHAKICGIVLPVVRLRVQLYCSTLAIVSCPHTSFQGLWGGVLRIGWDCI